MTFSIPVEPNYDPTNLNSRGATLSWLANASLGNPTGGYLNLADEAFVTNGDNQGQWADADAAHVVPAEWLALHPDIPNPQYWVPKFPALPNNLIYQYITTWGRDGYSLNVLGAEAKAAIAASLATIVQPPAPKPVPVPKPVPPPNAILAFIERNWQRFKSWL